MSASGVAVMGGGGGSWRAIRLVGSGVWVAQHGEGKEMGGVREGVEWVWMVVGFTVAVAVEVVLEVGLELRVQYWRL